MNDQATDTGGPMRGALDSITERLATRYHGVFSHETCQLAVSDAWESLVSQATLIPPFMPALAEHFAGDQLRAAAQVEGLVPKELSEVLFVCVHNAGRSQMAAALAHSLGAGRIHVRSAGSQPRHEIYPAVIEAMSEIGLDVTQDFPKPLTDIVVRAADVVITMGCGDACPIYAGKRYEDWDVANPADQPIDVVRGIRDEIEARVRQLLETLPAPSDSAHVGSAS
jgi:protein-tyrosine-phosphatase